MVMQCSASLLQFSPTGPNHTCFIAWGQGCPHPVLEDHILSRFSVLPGRKFLLQGKWNTGWNRCLTARTEILEDWDRSPPLNCPPVGVSYDGLVTCPGCNHISLPITDRSKQNRYSRWLYWRDTEYVDLTYLTRCINRNEDRDERSQKAAFDVKEGTADCEDW